MAKQYQTGNGFKLCPRCGIKKNPLDTTCKKCGHKLKNLDIFLFGTNDCSDSIRTILKAYRSNVHTLDQKIITLRKEKLEFVRTVKHGSLVKDAIFEAVSLGSSAAVRELASIYAKGELDGEYSEHIADILSLLCTAASCGSSLAARALYSEGYRYKLDCASDWKNVANGVQIVTVAAEMGLTWGKYCLGRFNFFGQCGLQKNLDEARRLINAAADDDYNPSERASRHVALCVFDGVGGYEKDIDLALAYARNAGALKNGIICEMLNRTDLCKGDKFVSRSKEDFDVSEQIDYLQLIRLIQDATERYRKIKCVSWAYSARDFGHDVNLRHCKYPHSEICAYLMNRAQAKKWADEYAKSRLGLRSSVYTGRGLVISAGEIYSSGADEDYDHRIEIRINDILSTRIPNLFSSRMSFDGLDCSRDELFDYLKFLRRYILWDRKGGVKLIDGSVQKEIIAKNVEVPITTIVTREVFKMDAPKVENSTIAILGVKSHGTNSLQQKKSSSSNAVPRMSRSTKKRWQFVLIGLFFGFLGFHFLYARRKGWFAFYWLLVVANVAQINIPLVYSVLANLSPALAKVPIFGIVASFVFVCSLFFMKMDGDGNLM